MLHAISVTTNKVRRMKRPELKKVNITKVIYHNRPFITFRRALRLAEDETKSDLNMPASRRDESVFPTYDELQKVNVQLLKLKRLEADGIRLTREHARCV